MSYKKSDISNIFLYDTKIENIFINEYMIDAPGEYVKVYLLGCMFAESNMSIDNDIFAKQLNISKAEVQDAWKFWEKIGAVKIKKTTDKTKQDQITIISLREKMFSGPSQEETPLNDEGLEKVYSALEKSWGILLDANQLEEIGSWEDFYGIDDEFIIFAIEFCGERDKKNVKYLEKVIQGWCEQGCKTIDDIQEHLDEVDQKYYRYKRVLRALGFNRNATEAEKAMMDDWFDNMKFTIDKVLKACEKTSGIGNPNFNYVNAVLINWQKEARSLGTDVNAETQVDRATLNEYLRFLREKEEKEAQDRQKEVYEKIPQLRKLDKEMAELGAEMSKAVVAGNTHEVNEIKERIDGLVGDRAILLTENNFEIDYTEVKYSCGICKDTGITDKGERCQCIVERAQEAKSWKEFEK